MFSLLLFFLLSYASHSSLNATTYDTYDTYGTEGMGLGQEQEYLNKRFSKENTKKRAKSFLRGRASRASRFFGAIKTKIIRSSFAAVVQALTDSPNALAFCNKTVLNARFRACHHRVDELAKGKLQIGE